MATIKKLQMASAVCALTCIDINKSFLGLRTSVTYLPTNSSVEVSTREYSANDGDRLKTILDAPRKDLQRCINGFRPTPTVNGNYLLEVCLSADHQFAALNLLRFQQMSYQPVGEVQVYEGDEATIIAKLF